MARKQSRTLTPREKQRIIALYQNQGQRRVADDKAVVTEAGINRDLAVSQQTQVSAEQKQAIIHHWTPGGGAGLGTRSAMHHRALPAR